jgi:2'-5' RNA ligase
MHDGVNDRNLEKIRTFIAVNLSPDIREHLAYLKDYIDIPESKMKWVEKNNLHITIKFLGYVSLGQIELIQSGLKEITGQYDPFLIKLSSYIGVFPTYKMPRIIWIGIKEGTNELEELYNSIEINMLKKGFPREEKCFSSHITIGRVKYIRDTTNFIRILKTIKVNTLSQEVCSIDLMESKLTPNGPVYNIAAKFPLSKQ